MLKRFDIQRIILFNLQNRSGEASEEKKRDTYCIEYYLTDGEYTVMDGVFYPIRKGMVFVSKPGVRRYSIGTYSCFGIHFCCFDDDFASQYLDKLSPIIIPSRPAAVRECFKIAIENLDRNNKGEELRQESVLLSLIAELVDSAELLHRLPSRVYPYIALMHQSADFMREHMSEHICADDLARRVNLSVNFYERTFASVLGEPPAKYLRGLRLREACRLLSGTDLNILDIAERCGLGDSSYITSFFKRELGVTPSRYRIENRILL